MDKVVPVYPSGDAEFGGSLWVEVGHSLGLKSAGASQGGQSRGVGCWSSAGSSLEGLREVPGPEDSVASVGQGGGSGPSSGCWHLLPTPPPSW